MIWRQFNRQDFEHPHFDKATQQYYKPHEHSYGYNENGFYNGPLTPGYDNIPIR